MLKVRITYVNDENGIDELKEFENVIKENHRILNKSKVYKGKGESLYNNIYFDIESK